MPQPIVQLKNLDITYNIGKENEYKATFNVSMEIYPEEYVAFFGPSGCGKSTLFYSILGILAPSAGQLLVKGENPYSFSPEKMVKFQTSTIGIIYQAFYLINSISVLDNIALPLIFHSAAPGWRKKHALSLLRRFGIEQHAEKYPDNLSGGQSQRVSVARALVNNPDILLADEPTGNLDSISTKQVMDALEEINQKDKKTVIMITHNAAQLKYCHRVFYMKDGRVERVVSNPEKKQIAKIDRQKMIVSEIDTLSKLYPYSTPIELKVKSLVNYLTQEMPIEQVQKLERSVQLVLERKINKQQFFASLQAEQKNGGVGLSPSAARTAARETEKIMLQSEEVQRYRRRLEQNNFFEREGDLVRKISGFLAVEAGGNLNPTQSKRLKELVHQRVSGLIRQEEFAALAALPLSNGGIGLEQKTAQRLTYYFEKIICQGIETKGHGH